MTTSPCVYVFHPYGGGPSLALALHICRSISEAKGLAREVRTIFGCPAWVADFDRPAERVRHSPAVP